MLREDLQYDPDEMHGKYKRQTAKGPYPSAVASAPAGADERAILAAEVDRLLEQGHSRPAVELAKEIHKRNASGESEALLVKAYAARILSLVKSGLEVEAAALLDLVRQRYPGSKDALAGIGVMLSPRASLDDLLRPLNDPACATQRRAEIESAIKRELIDLQALAQCEALAAGHPLRVGAARLHEAFQAVTTGPVLDDALAVPEVSRRSPLAPWKTLVRAIASFYRNDDSACARWLQLVEAGSAPARLAPALFAMLSNQGAPKLRPGGAALVAEVSGKESSLRKAVEALDAAFATGKRRQILSETQNAVGAAKEACPELLERLKQHISVRAHGLRISYEAVRAAMRSSSLKDAHFWHLLAREAEHPRRIQSLGVCSLWEEFRKHAVHQGWFRSDGPEIAALYLHMADVLQHVPLKELANLQERFRERFAGYEYYYQDQPAAIQEAGAQRDPVICFFIYPEQLYARACAIDPHPEIFGQWLEWARKCGDWHLSDQAAEAWRKALPKDSRPLLHLMESAEKRGSLKKALGYLEAAEGLDALNPEVRRARLRLLAATAMRHLGQRKINLVERDLADLEALPQAREGDRPAFLAALRWALSLFRNDGDGASRYFADVAELLQSHAAATLTLTNLASLTGLGVEAVRFADGKIIMDPGVSLAGAVARACGLGEDLGLEFVIPPACEKGLLNELADGRGNLDARQLRLLAEAALRLDRQELAFAASGTGLAKGGVTEARFLLLRARALPEWEFERGEKCLVAAAELARRQRDMALVDEAIELHRGAGRRHSHFFDWIDSLEPRSFSMSSEDLNNILQREKKDGKFPTFRARQFSHRFEPSSQAGEDDDDAQDDPFRGLDLGQMADLVEELFGPLDAEKGPRKKRSPAPPGQRSLF